MVSAIVMHSERMATYRATVSAYIMFRINTIVKWGIALTTLAGFVARGPPRRRGVAPRCLLRFRPVSRYEAARYRFSKHHRPETVAS